MRSDIEPTSSSESAEFSLSAFWLLLVLGVALRLCALEQPMVDAMMYRQAQTASVTESLGNQPGWPVVAKVHWVGDREAPLLLELPLYNYLVLGLNRVVRDLDISGKLTSVWLWAFSFFLLQPVWRRLLRPAETNWANLLFVLAPLEVFYGQAFMPEMLIQSLGVGFVLALLRYQERPTFGRFLVWAVVGLVGMLVKLPEMLHLYILAALVILAHEHWRALLNWRYWAALVTSALVVKLWSDASQRVNQEAFPEWTPHAMLPLFIGSLHGRIEVWRIFKLLQYPAILIVGLPGMWFVAVGLRQLWRERSRRLLVFWLLAVVAFYLIWAGPVAWTQAYYNLPAVPILSALFALGICSALEWGRRRSGAWLQPRRLAPAFLLVLFPFLAAGILFEFHQDHRALYDGAIWLREHTRPEDLVLVKANHHSIPVQSRSDICVVSYYAKRRLWALINALAGPERQHAVEASSWVLITLPPQHTSSVEHWRRWLRKSPFVPEDVSWLGNVGFKRYYEGNGFVILHKESPKS